MHHLLTKLIHIVLCIVHVSQIYQRNNTSELASLILLRKLVSQLEKFTKINKSCFKYQNLI